MHNFSITCISHGLFEAPCIFLKPSLGSKESFRNRLIKIPGRQTFRQDPASTCQVSSNSRTPRPGKRSVHLFF